MKLNPPETAPKKGAIFAKFNGSQLLPAVWDSNGHAWNVAMTFAIKVNVKPLPVQFESINILPERLTGWIPIPRIDEKGNVAWPSPSLT